MSIHGSKHSDYIYHSTCERFEFLCCWQGDQVDISPADGTVTEAKLASNYNTGGAGNHVFFLNENSKYGLHYPTDRHATARVQLQ